jgi:hypothetical protein
MALLNRSPPLEDRITALRAEIDAFIDARAEAMAKESPGVPLLVIRNLITAKGGYCHCEQFIQTKKVDDEEQARKAADKPAKKEIAA